MSMALALEFVTEWFRDKHGWKHNECGVQFDAIPAVDAGQFYVAIDDAGVEVGSESTDSLKEILNITVGIWRRPEHLQKDRHGHLKLPYDKYLIGAYTLHRLERAILVHKTEAGVVNQDYPGLHGNWDFRAKLNTRYNLPGELGAEFLTPLTYRGRSRMETMGIDSGTSVQAWYGYRLRFRGLMREQKMRSATDAIG